MNVLCFLSVRPSPAFYATCKAFQAEGGYAVFLCVDDPSYKIPGYDGAVPLIQLPTGEAEAAGFKDTVLQVKNRASSRDKALYYFAQRYRGRAEHIWFLEEDVFLASTRTLRRLDANWGPHYDLLSRSHTVEQARPTSWHWPHIFTQMDLPPPYSSSMICAVRVSRRLLSSIREYADTHKTLFMDEALFNTLALQRGMRVGCPRELYTVEFKCTWEDWEFDWRNLYHPMKNVAEQERLRVVLSRDMSIWARLFG